MIEKFPISDNGKKPILKKCSRCYQFLPLSQYYKRPNDKYEPHCKTCNQKRYKEWANRNREMNKNRNIYDNSLKFCNRCKNKKPRIKKEWSEDLEKKDGLRTLCRKCSSESRRYAHKRRRYNLTKEEILQMLEDQIYTCKICGEKLKNDKKTNIDHDHKTGKIRGLLCGLCNYGLGHFKDNPMILFNAIKYLQKDGDIL